MTLVAALIGVLVAAGWAGPRLLRRLGRAASKRVPRLALTMWLSVTGGWVAGLLLAGPLVASTFTGSAGDAPILQTCTRCMAAMRDGYGLPATLGIPPLPLLVASTALAAWLLAVAGWQAFSAHRVRVRHLATLRSVARREVIDGLSVWVLPSDVASAYCLPGRARHVVLTTAAAERLRPAERQAVVAHERAHQRGRHHLITAWFLFLRRAFGRVPLIQTAQSEAARLVELLADDHARRVTGAAPLAHAVAALAADAAPNPERAAGYTPRQPVLAATGACPVERVARLVRPAPPASRARAIAVMTAAAMLSAGTVLTMGVIQPAVTLLLLASC